eukprot:m.213573 g.213573  ORF g.213573 m.213573 type:complete len:246 (+) comp25564_c2_seq9:240-977(+)
MQGRVAVHKSTLVELTTHASAAASTANPEPPSTPPVSQPYPPTRRPLFPALASTSTMSTELIATSIMLAADTTGTGTMMPPTTTPEYGSCCCGRFRGLRAVKTYTYMSSSNSAFTFLSWHSALAFVCALSVNAFFSVLSINSIGSVASLNSVFSIFSTNSFFSVNCTLGYFQICGGDDGQYIAIGLAFMAVAVMAFGLISITADDRRAKRAACKRMDAGQPLLAKTAPLSDNGTEMQLASGSSLV